MLELNTIFKQFGSYEYWNDPDTMIGFINSLNFSNSNDKLAIVNYKDNEHGMTPLMLACESHDAKIAQILLDWGANLYETSHNGFSPFLFCIGGSGNQVAHDEKSSKLKAQRFNDTFDFLVKSGAEFEYITKEGDYQNAFVFACEMNKRAVAQKILAVKPDINIKSVHNKTALDWAQEHKNQQLIDLIVLHIEKQNLEKTVFSNTKNGAKHKI